MSRSIIIDIPFCIFYLSINEIQLEYILVWSMQRNLRICMLSFIEKFVKNVILINRFILDINQAFLKQTKNKINKTQA